MAQMRVLQHVKVLSWSWGKMLIVKSLLDPGYKRLHNLSLGNYPVCAAS